MFKTINTENSKLNAQYLTNYITRNYRDMKIYTFRLFTQVHVGAGSWREWVNDHDKYDS